MLYIKEGQYAVVRIGNSPTGMAEARLTVRFDGGDDERFEGKDVSLTRSFEEDEERMTREA
jgi:hypothetical protein